ncbi:MAG: efflux RND transporter periplasmic adaptor subunit [Chitinophagaceae bacterium]
MNKTLLLISLLFTAGFTACTSKKEEKKETVKLPVTSPVLMDTTIARDYVAEIQSVQNIEVRAKVKGYLEMIDVDEGQLVSSGQTLFRIRSREYEAELAKAQAQVKTNELELQNVKTLADKNIVSQTELGLATAKLNEAKAEAGVAETNLSFTKITAPFGGIVDRLKFKVGSLVDEGTLLTSLSNNKEVYAYFNVSEAEYLDYKTRHSGDEKNKVSLLLANGQEHKYKGTIETIEGEFDKEVGSIAFRAKFPNPDLLLKHGETGKVQVTINIKNALIIPQKATFDIQDRTYVYVVDQNNVVKSKAISIKQKLSNIYVIENDLSEKDKILLEGLQSVKEGDVIRSEFIPAKQVIDHLQLIEQ